MTDRCLQYLAPYDWRLSYSNLEERDGYFSRLKVIIEGFKYVFLSRVSNVLETRRSLRLMDMPGKDRTRRLFSQHIQWEAR
jgi:hypothetical protein